MSWNNICQMPCLYLLPVAHIESAVMDKEQLIHLFKMRSHLYDTSSFHYKNLNNEAAGWKDIAR